MNNPMNQSSKEERGKRLRYIRDEMLRMSRREFSNRHLDLKISQHALHNWEEARFSGLNETHANIILKALKKENVSCDKDWLLYGQGNPPTFNALNEIATIGKFKETEIIANELRIFRASYVDAVDAIISDECLSPCFLTGDHVAGVRYTGNNIRKALGKVCIIQTYDGKVLIRKVTIGESDDFYNLLSTHPDFKNAHYELFDIQLFSAAPIHWWRRPFS
jgi:hypothetical protein